MKLTQKTTSSFILLLIILIITLGQATRDIFIPSLPAITSGFHIHPSVSQSMLTTYLLGFALSQLIYGPLSDYYGRRIILLLGVFAFVLSSLISTLAPDATILLISRLLEGVSIGTAPVLARSIMFDHFKEKRLLVAAGYVSMAASLTPAIAPLLGGYFQEWIGWRANFGFLVIYGILIGFLILFFLPETNVAIKKDPIDLKKILKKYALLFVNYRFVSYAFCVMLIGGTLSAYNATLPFLTQTQLGLTPIEYGWIGMALVFGFLIGVIISKNLFDVIDPQKIVFIGLVLMMVNAILMSVFSLFGYLNLYVLVFPIAFIMMGAGFIHPIAIVKVMQSVENATGVLAASLGCLGMLGGAISSNIMSYFKIQDQTPLALFLLIVSFLVLFQFIVYLKRSVKVS